jgi:acetoin:2,6-dichlorophenolindophenol oxidoreductase subunit alpha
MSQTTSTGAKSGAKHDAAEAAQRWLHMYYQMLQIRFFEDQVNDLYRTARMPGLAHLYSGEEAVAVGVCAALRRDDYITSTHRGHGHCLAKGARVDRMFAELLGKESGYCKGKGGSMHIADQDTGNLGANAIVGGSAGIATGAAFSSRWRKSDQVTVCFFGDGALGQGVLYEVMNMASLWKLPIIYVCENNLYNEYTHFSETTAGSLAERAKAFAIPAEEIDGQDARAVFVAAERMVARARTGEGPSFIVANTYRYHGHHVGDISRSYYRPLEEEDFWKTQRDPIELLGNWLVSEHVADADQLAELRQKAKSDVEAGVRFGLTAPFPAESEVTQDVYA